MSSMDDNILTKYEVNKLFNKSWVANLFIKYYTFLKDRGVGTETIKRHLSKAKMLFENIEKSFLEPSNINYEWIENQLDQIDYLRGANKSIVTFLAQERIIKVPNNDDLIQKSIESMIDRCSPGFRNLLQIYYNERLDLRRRHLNNNASKPLSLITIRADMEMFLRFVRWIRDNHELVISWSLVQEQHIHQFLLTLTPKNREIVRKDLYVLFKFAKRRRIIACIPIADFPSRELPGTIEILDFIEQKSVAKAIKDNLYIDSIQCFLASLCFYHGLSSSEISNIKVKDLDIDGRKIFLQNRPPVYLSDEDMNILNEYAKIRASIRNSDKKQYLILSRSTGELYEDKPVSKKFIANKVKDLAGYTPKALRISCFSAMAANFGPQILIEAFGLSLTQSSRYGKFEDYLLEEELKLQKETLK